MSDPRRWLDPASDAGEGARELLGRAPKAPPMSADAKARVAAKLAAATALPVAGAKGVLGWKLLFGAGVIGVAALVLSWRVTLVRDRATRPAAPIAHVTSTAGVPRETRESPPIEMPANPLAAASPSTNTGPTPAVTSSTSTPNVLHHNQASAHREPTASASASSRPDELEMVQRASALVDRDPRAAIGLAREHEVRFPHGDYVEERESILVRALANAGQTRAAHDRAERFLREYPSSIYATRIRGTLQNAR